MLRMLKKNGWTGEDETNNNETTWNKGTTWGITKK